MVSRHFCAFLLLHLLAVPGAPARAASSVHWLCWLGSQDDYNIHCLRESDPVLEDIDAIQSDRHDETRTQDDRIAGDAPRTLAGAGRDASRSAPGILWSIPLYTMPFDLTQVELLARTVMCGTNADCVLQFDRFERQVASH